MRAVSASVRACSNIMQGGRECAISRQHTADRKHAKLYGNKLKWVKRRDEHPCESSAYVFDCTLRTRAVPHCSVKMNYDAERFESYMGRNWANQDLPGQPRNANKKRLGKKCSRGHCTC